MGIRSVSTIIVAQIEMLSVSKEVVLTHRQAEVPDIAIILVCRVEIECPFVMCYYVDVDPSTVTQNRSDTNIPDDTQSPKIAFRLLDETGIVWISFGKQQLISNQSLFGEEVDAINNSPQQMSFGGIALIKYLFSGEADSAYAKGRIILRLAGCDNETTEGEKERQ
jgi:hypothetical protein